MLLSVVLSFFFSCNPFTRELLLSARQFFGQKLVETSFRPLKGGTHVGFGCVLFVHSGLARL